jgi:hypothetical protein
MLSTSGRPGWPVAFKNEDRLVDESMGVTAFLVQIIQETADL